MSHNLFRVLGPYFVCGLSSDSAWLHFGLANTASKRRGGKHRFVFHVKNSSLGAYILESSPAVDSFVKLAWNNVRHDLNMATSNVVPFCQVHSL